MPKEVKELSIFKEGLISNASSLDIPDEAAAYSDNIDCELEGGTLGPITKDSIYTKDGWQTPSVNEYYLYIPQWFTDEASAYAFSAAEVEASIARMNNQYFILNPQEGINRIAIILKTSGSGHDNDLSTHTLSNNLNTELVPLTQYCPDIEAGTVTAYTLDLTGHGWTTGDGVGRGASGFMQKFIDEFVQQWNATTITIKSADQDTGKKDISLSSLFTATKDADKNRIVIKPVSQANAIGYRMYNQYGDSTSAPTPGDFGNTNSQTITGATRYSYGIKVDVSDASAYAEGDVAKVNGLSTVADGHYLILEEDTTGANGLVIALDSGSQDLGAISGASGAIEKCTHTPFFFSGR